MPIELDRRKTPTTKHSSDEKLFMRVTGLSKDEWVQQMMADHGLSSAAVLKKYREMLHDIVERNRKRQLEDEQTFRQAVAAMRGTDEE